MTLLARVSCLPAGSLPGIGAAQPMISRVVSTALTGAAAAAIRLGSTAAAAILLAHLRLAGRPATICPLRALTGLPCPLCGGTTAAVRLGHFDLFGALAANPVAVVFGVALVTSPLALGPGGLERLSATGRRKLTRAIIVALVLSEIWQLSRFGIL